MVPDVNLSDKFSYDGEECLRLYHAYQNGGSLEEFLRYLKRHIIMRVRKGYLKRVRRDVCEDLIQSVLIELWLLVIRRPIPACNVALFHSFLNTVIHRKIAKTFAEIYDDAPKKMDGVVYVSEMLRRIPGSDDEETAQYLKELGPAIRERILASLRPMPENVRQAIDLVLTDVLIHNDMVAPVFLKRECKIEDPDFLIEHVFIRIKAELYKMREDLSFRTNSEKKDVLHEGLQEFFTDS